MELKDFALGVLTAAFIFGAYFLGLFQGHRRSIEWREFFTSIGHSLTWQGFLWSMTLPLLWLGLYFGLAVHLRATLGHWPTAIGQNPDSWLFAVHEKAAWQLAVIVAHSLYALPAVIVLSLLLKRWRHVGVYALSYGGAVVIAYLLMNLAPSSFVNWWWDLDRENAQQNHWSECGRATSVAKSVSPVSPKQPSHSEACLWN